MRVVTHAVQIIESTNCRFNKSATIEATVLRYSYLWHRRVQNGKAEIFPRLFDEKCYNSQSIASRVTNQVSLWSSPHQLSISFPQYSTSLSCNLNLLLFRIKVFNFSFNSKFFILTKLYVVYHQFIRCKGGCVLTNDFCVIKILFLRNIQKSAIEQGS